MAAAALDLLLQSLLQIRERDDDLTTRRVKHRILCIRDKALIMLHFLPHFPEKETIREVADTTLEIIEYLFSPQNLSADCGSIHPSVRLSDHLRELAEELDSTVGDVVDYIRQWSDSPAFSSSAKSALESEVEDLEVATELIVINTNGLRRLAEKIKSTGRELVDEDLSDSPLIPAKDVAVDFDEDLSDSTAASSSRPASITKYFEPDFAQDPSEGAVFGRYENTRMMIAGIINYSLYSYLLNVLPIVGMGGIGKSTLATHIYNHPDIMKHFDIRAWVTVSQDYCVPSIVSQLLASLKGKVDPVGKDSSIVIDAEKLEIFKILSGRRYLIVLDDIWSVEAWDRIRWLFPNKNNGSRIILTTRLMDVATYAATRMNIHMMRFLDDEQSWRLFHHKLFGDQDCPQELRSVGEKIVKGCGGLPLSIVNAAGLLSRIPRTPKLWNQIEVHDGQLGSILSVSYNHLPPHLRKCFLYMAAFPLDYDICASELIKLWVTEGFLERHNESERVQVMAKGWLEELINQSLVLITSRKFDGKTKSCRLHIMVRDFCVREAGREKFLLSVMDYLPTPILRRHFLPQVLQNHHRLSVSWHDLHLKDSTHSSCTTSIICIPQRGYRPKGSVQNFTSLRILHVLLRNDHLYWELGQVFKLINLTYLAFSIPDSIVPPAIAKLQNLQTLIIYRYDVCLPVEIWRLRKLRHLIAFSFQPLPLPKVATPLKNLQTLSIATNFVCSESLVNTIPSITKLGIFYSEEEFGAGYHLYNLIHLLRLEKLKLKMHSSSVQHFHSLNFPLSLNKLELSGGWISWTDMTIVGSLPNLQVLKLKKYACYGDRWETIEGEFDKLTHLLIDESNLKHWKTRSSHFPMLKYLMLHRCPDLDDIPDGIGFIPSLELIEIDDHRRSQLHSANIIEVIHADLEGKGFKKVVVKRC